MPQSADSLPRQWAPLVVALVALLISVITSIWCATSLRPDLLKAASSNVSGPSPAPSIQPSKPVIHQEDLDLSPDGKQNEYWATTIVNGAVVTDNARTSARRLTITVAGGWISHPKGWCVSGGQWSTKDIYVESKNDSSIAVDSSHKVCTNGIFVKGSNDIAYLRIMWTTSS
jgi:hypothetical protein